jgi:hypothetical protein
MPDKERDAMSDEPLIYYPTRRPSVDYVTQPPCELDEGHLAEIHLTRLRMEWFGAPPICFLPECRRAGQCCGDPQKGRYYLPPCFGHYREEVRFMIFAPGGMADVLEEAGLATEADEAEDDDSEPLPEHLPKDTLTVLELYYGPGAKKYERLRRSPQVLGPGGWEIDPEGFDRYIEAGDWRHPEGVCYRPPMRYRNRLID